MPYIQQSDKETFVPILNELQETYIGTPGELNYLLTKICLHYAGKTPRYQTYNDIIGALECCKLELYRRQIALYEDKKIKENGDVF